MDMKIRKLTQTQFEPPEELRGITPNSLTTTDPPYLDSKIPKSSTQLFREGMRIYAYPSMRLVKRFSDEEKLEKEMIEMRAQLVAFRLDLTRPFGTCPFCALPFQSEAKTEHVCP